MRVVQLTSECGEYAFLILSVSEVVTQVDKGSYRSNTVYCETYTSPPLTVIISTLHDAGQKSGKNPGGSQSKPSENRKKGC